MNFTDFIGHEDAKLALILNAIDLKCGGVLFIGSKGCGKSSLARLLPDILDAGAPFVELPLNITEDSLLGGIALEQTIVSGQKKLQPGILSRVNGGVLHIDDVNLLNLDIMAHILEVHGRGSQVIEREGLSERCTSRFIIVAGMNPESGALSLHLLDRFGLCVLWETLSDKAERIAVMKSSTPTLWPANNAIKSNQSYFMRAIPPTPSMPIPLQQEDRVKDSQLQQGYLTRVIGNDLAALKARIAVARSRLEHIVINDTIRAYIAELCLRAAISGHRGDIHLLYAARAYAAWQGQPEVSQTDVDSVVHLVLSHRQRHVTEPEHEHSHPSLKDQPNNEKQDQQDRENAPLEVASPQETQPDDATPLDTSPQERPSHPREEVHVTGEVFKTRRLVFRKDCIKRNSSGRRTKTMSKDMGGRYVKSTPRGKQDVAIDATLRAAALFQSVRGRTGRLIIKEEDLRYKQREKRMGHLVIFVVDGSGSMGARARMSAAKGAVQSLLADCYQRRDKVAMIVFRKDRAEVVLSPTASVALATRRLTEIPVGGKTPLASGLLEAYRLIQRVAMKSPETRFLLTLITDGRANHGLGEEDMARELAQLTNLLAHAPSADSIVIDTEDKSGLMRMDLAAGLAAQLQADYYIIDSLKADYLAGIVQMKMSGKEQ